MAAPLSEKLHRVRDALLVAAGHLERGDENAAAETIEKASAEIRQELEAK